MNTVQILVTRRLTEEAMQALQAIGPLFLWDEDRPIPRQVLCDKIRKADGLLCLLTDKIDADVLAQAPRLRAVSTMSVGFDHIDIDACTKRGVQVGHTPGVLTEATADLTWTLLMSAARRVMECADFVKSGSWTTWSPLALLGQEVHASTLGIVGFGRIGKAMARRATGFGMRLLVYHSSDLDSRCLSQYSATQVSWDRLVQESDYLSLHVPLTPQTRHIINAEALRKMKPTSVLINTARGGLIDTEALYEALQTNIIGAAALDVTDPEPLPSTHPLLSLSNCLVLPHVGSATAQTRAKMARMAVENLAAGLQGHPMPFGINIASINPK